MNYRHHRIIEKTAGIFLKGEEKKKFEKMLAAEKKQIAGDPVLKNRYRGFMAGTLLGGGAAAALNLALDAKKDLWWSSPSLFKRILSSRSFRVPFVLASTTAGVIGGSRLGGGIVKAIQKKKGLEPKFSPAYIKAFPEDFKDKTINA